MERWVVVQTQPNREAWAAENIARQGYEYYLPQILETRKVQGRQRVGVAKPLFPRYLFVHITGRWKSLLGTFGVASVILNGENPAPVPDSVIADLRAREIDGLVQLPPEPTHPKPQVGQQVRITSGVFADRVGIYDGMGGHDRERVLLDYLGRRTPVLIAEGALSLE